MLARYTSSEVSAIVRNVKGLEGVEAWSRVHANNGIMAIMQWEENRKDSRFVETGGSVGNFSDARRAIR